MAQRSADIIDLLTPGSLANDEAAGNEVDAPKPKPKKKKSAALHSAATPRWGTPGGKEDSVVERARRAMGSIDFDPCSEAGFNEVVRAAEYYSLLEKQQDALKLPWLGKTRLVNHPGGWTIEFWNKTMSESQGDVQSIWIGFSLEQLGILADEEYHPSDFCIVYPRKRIKFTRHDGFSGSPSHSNYICGINVEPAAFYREFSSMGRVQFGRSVIGHEFVEALLVGRKLHVGELHGREVAITT